MARQLLGTPIPLVEIDDTQAGGSLGGTEYEAFLWVFPFSTDAELTFDFLCFDAPGGKITMAGSVRVPRDEPWWHKVELKATIPSGVTRGRGVVGGTFNSGVVWVDDAQVTTGGKPIALKNAGFEER